MGETVVLENSVWGGRAKTVLTCESIIRYRKEGWLSSKWVVSTQIPLDQVEEAYVDTGGAFVQNSKVQLKMKNGEAQDLP